MNGDLLDTNVISATAPANPARVQAVIDWLEANDHMLFLSIVTIAEIESGIANARRKQASQKARVLSDWLDVILSLYGRRVIALDIAVAQASGRLDSVARGVGVAPGFADIATAEIHGLMILTRSTRHFQQLGLPFVDPFSDPLP